MSPLFTADDIAREVARLAREIAARTPSVDCVVPVLTGAFVFAADLVRALAREGRHVRVEFVSLTRYGDARDGGDIAVRLGATDALRGRHVLLVDGVLDHGHTLVKAGAMLAAAGTASVATAVVVDKRRPDGLLVADHAAFTNVDAFIVGYGMDDAGECRGLPFIARVD